MGISQQIGASSLIKAGVCTSTTRPASPYEGQVIFETDTDKLLVWNNTAWVIPNQTTQNPEGLEWISSVTVPNSTTTYFDIGTMSSSYDIYRLVFSSVAPSAANDIYLTLVTSGGSESTGSYVNQYAGATNANAFTASYATRTNQIISSSSGSSYKHVGVVDIFSPFIADYTTIISSSYLARTDLVGFGFNCRHEVATSYTTLRIRPSSGSISGGVFSLYGYRKS